MRKITLLFAVLLSLLGVTQVKAETADFENALPTGWETVGTMNYYERAKTGSYSIGNDKNSSWDTNRGNYIKTTKLEGDITLWLRSYKSGSTGYVSLYELSDDGETVGNKLTSFSSSSTTFVEKTYTLTAATRLAIVINYAHLDNMTYTEYVAATVPVLTVKDGSTKISTGYSYDFGLATAGTTKSFTLSNTGAGTIEGLSVSETGSFDATLSATSIAAGDEVTLTITMPATTSNSAITISSTTDGIADFVINASGTIRDANKVYLDFADGQIPEGWSNVMIGSYGNGWVAAEGYVGHSNSASSYYLAAFTSPLLGFAEGETLYFDVARYGSSTYNTSMVKVQTSTDGTTWTDLYTTPDDNLVYGEWKTQSVTMSAGNYYIRFYGGYACITNIYGGELPMVANMKVTASDHNFGLITSAASTVFNIKNTGRATLTGIQVTSSDAAFTITDAPASLEAGADADVTVTMSASTVGAKSATITVEATDMDPATFNVSGYVADADALTITFDDNQVPEGWENTGWTFSNKTATGVYTAATTSRNSEMISPAISVAEGETMAIEAKGNGSYAELYVYTSTDNGATWTQKKSFNTEMRANTSDYTVVVVDNIEEGSYKLKIEGYSVTVNTINGYHLDANAPALTVTPADAAAFGKVKAQPAAKTYTIANTGTGTLTGTIASDNAAFTVSKSEFSLGQGESTTFDINLVFDENYGAKAAVITVHPTNTGLTDITINATATTADPNVWDEDFESGEFAAEWENEGKWTVTTPTASGSNGTKMAYISSYNNPKALTTPRLEAKADDQLTFYIGMQYSDEPLTIEYSNDGRATWNKIEAGVDSYTASGDITFTAPADGFYYIRFTGTYAMLDNFLGFKEAPLAHDAIVSATNIPTTGTQYAEYTATVTVKEKAGKNEELTAKFFIGSVQYGENVVETVEANGTKTFTVTFTPNEAVSGDAYFTISNDDLNLETAKTAVTIAAAMVLDETVAPELASGTQPSVVVKYTAHDGWNTISMPFELTDDIMDAIFGTGWKAYELKGYADGALNFQKSTSFFAGYAYLVYVETAATHADGVILNNVNISATSPKSDSYSGATFYASYAPIAAPGMEGKYGVTSEGKIAKGTDKASIRGFRGYIELPSSAKVARIVIDGEDIATGIDAVKLLNNGGEAIYNLNGQRMAQPQRGSVNIVNGKKVFIK